MPQKLNWNRKPERGWGLWSIRGKPHTKVFDPERKTDRTPKTREFSPEEKAKLIKQLEERRRNHGG